MAKIVRFEQPQPPRPKLKVLALRFSLRISPRWLINKWGMFMIRRNYRRDPAAFDRQMRKALRGGSSAWVEFVVSSMKDCLTDPKAFRLKQ